MITFIAGLVAFGLEYTNPKGTECYTIVQVAPELSDADLEKYHKSAAETCFKKYPQSQCLARFVQVGPNDFKATCGRS